MVERFYVKTEENFRKAMMFETVRQLNHVDRTILGIATALLLIFSYFLYDDRILFKNSEETQTEIIGQIYFFENDVRRKGTGSYSWVPASKQENVHNLDSLFTGKQSQASIQLQDGSLIHVRENSLILLSVNQGQFELDLKYGDLIGEVKKDQKIQIRSGQESFNLKSTEQDSSVIIRRNRVGKSDVQSLRGKPEVTSVKTGKVVSLQTSKSTDLVTPPAPPPVVVAKPTPPPPPVPIQKIDFIQPEKTIISQKDLSQPISLSWRTTGTFTEYKIEIKKTPEDPKSLFETTSKQSQTEVRSGLNEGSYVWRIQGYDDQKKLVTETAYQPLQLVSTAPLFWLSPKMGENIDAAKTDLEMEWSGSEAQKFEWQISKDISFKNIEHQGQAITSQTKIQLPVPQIYWARVRAFKNNNEWTDWSEPSKFTIKSKAPTNLKAPILSKKKYETTASGQRGIASIPAVKIQWNAVDGADTYILETSETHDFQKPTTQKVNTPGAIFQKFTQRQHFARVRAQSKSGVLSPYSEVSQIEVTSLNQPLLSPIEDQMTSSPKAGEPPPSINVSAQWSTVAFADKYQLQLSKDNSFKEVQTVEAKSAQAQFKLTEPGLYYSRVRPIDNSGKPLTDYSNTIKFEYIFKSPILAPNLMEPFNKTTVFLQKDIEPFIWLEWKRIPEATHYEVQISNDPQFKTILVTGNSENHRFLLKEKVPLGSIYWRVRAISKKLNLQSPWSQARVFSLIHKKNETQIE